MSAKEVKVRLQSQSNHVVARGLTFKELLFDCKQKLQVNSETSVQLVFESNLQIINDDNFNSLKTDEEVVLQRKDHETTQESVSSLAEDKSRGKSKSIVLEHKRNYVGQIIYKGHPSWVLMQNIQTGIRHYVGKSSEVILQSDLLKQNPQDQALFKSPKALAFPPNGSAETQPHKTGLFKFKDYCPLAFRHLRQKFCIDPADYMVSLCNTLEDGQNALRELPTPGKSGSLFFFSHDMKYIIKTIPKREAKLLRTLLPEYYKHVMENINTLLPKFFGLCRVKPHGGRQVRFVIMGNVFATNKKIHARYDLKGSLVGRAASEEEVARFQENVTFKDIDWRNQHRKLILSDEMKHSFVDQLKKDCALLEKLHIMDYSLLVGIHNCTKNHGRDCSLACAFNDNNNNHTPNTKFREKRKKKRRKDEKKPDDKHDSSDPQTSNSPHTQEPSQQSSTHSTSEPTPQTDIVQEPKVEEQPNNDNTQPSTTTSNADIQHGSPSKEAPIDGNQEPSRKFSVTSASSRGGKEKVKDSESRDSIPGWLNSLRLKGSGNGTGRKMPSGPKAQTSYPLPEKYKTTSPSIFQQDDGGMKSAANDDEHYFVGIIDILMLYTIKKWAEHAIKSIRFEPDEISSINPQDYSHRFQDFVTSQTMTPHEYQDYQQQLENRSSADKSRTSTDHKHHSNELKDEKLKHDSTDKHKDDHKHASDKQKHEHHHSHEHTDDHKVKHDSTDKHKDDHKQPQHSESSHEHNGEDKEILNHEKKPEGEHSAEDKESHHHHEHHHSHEHHEHSHSSDHKHIHHEHDHKLQDKQPEATTDNQGEVKANQGEVKANDDDKTPNANGNSSPKRQKEKKTKKAKRDSPKSRPKQDSKDPELEF